MDRIFPTLTIAVIIILGLVLPILEYIVPQKLDQTSLQKRLVKVISNVSEDLSSSDVAYLTRFLANGGQLRQGLALYPRFHKPHQMGSVWRIYNDRPYSHMDFYLSYPGDIGVVLLIEDSPQFIPHASEVLVFNCYQEEDIQALSVVIFDEDGSIEDVIWRSNIPELPACPLPINE
jgi:hypothetical protein